MYKLRKNILDLKEKKMLVTIICLLRRIIKSMMAKFFSFFNFFLWIIDIIKLKLEYNKDRNKKVHSELEVIKVEEVLHLRKRNSFSHLIFLCTSSILSKLMCNSVVVHFSDVWLHSYHNFNCVL